MKYINTISEVETQIVYQAKEKNIPINGSIELLPLCNMNCDMCYVRLSREEMNTLGKLRTGEEWLALGKEMIQSGTLFLLLTGGEPLLHPDFKTIYLGLKKMGMILTLNTNATLIDQEWASFFCENKPRRINITLYGANNHTYEKMCHYPGGFDRVLNAIKLLREQNVDVRLGCSMTTDNVNDLSEMYKIANNLDVPIQTDTYMLPAIRERKKSFNEQKRLSPEDAATLRIQSLRLEMDENQFEQFRQEKINEIDSFKNDEEKTCSVSCLAGSCSFSINWQGNLRPCVICTEPVASVFDIGFVKAWNQVSEAFRTVRYCSKCSVCKLRSLCPTCAIASKIETGSYMEKPEYLCRYTKELERLLRKNIVI